MLAAAARHKWGRSPATLLLALCAPLLLVACSNDTTEEPALAAESTTTTEAPTATTQPLTPDETAVAELWEQTLGILEIAGVDERAAAAAELEDRILTDDFLEQARRFLILPEPIEFSSNAVFTPGVNGEVTIADCTETSAPTALGPTTAGFTATAATDDNGNVVLSEFATFASCIQEDIAAAALGQYELFLQANKEFWEDPRIDNPAVGRYATDNAAEGFRSYLAELEELGRLGDRFLQLDSVEEHLEVIYYVPGEVRIRNCEQGDETYGLFDGDGQRRDQLGPPWQADLIVRMVEVDGEWLFDELINRTNGACDPGPSSSGLRPL